MNITDELLIDYMLGEASAETRMLVDEWLLDEANHKYYEQFVTLWDASKLPVADVDVEAALAKVHTQLPEYNKRGSVINFRVMRVAAAVLLLAGGAAAVYLQQQHTTQTAVADVVPAIGTESQPAKPSVTYASRVATTTSESVRPEQITSAGTGEIRHNKPIPLLSDCGNPGQYACNKTPCPIEICITQKSTCKDGKPTETSYCSVIRPDESGGICYRPHEEKVPHCGTIVEQITITRIGTGETIVLDDKSRIKAQDLFNHITGEDCGSMIAGAFTKDCSNNADEEELTINNSGGQLHFW
jgi:hypothetical protein